MHISIRSWAIHCLIACLGLATLLPAGAEEREKKISAQAGSPVLVDVVGCADNSKSPTKLPEVSTVVSGSKTFIIYESKPDQRDDRSFIFDIGAAKDPGGSGCAAPIENRKYTVSFTTVPEVSGQALQTSFVVLMAALLLALLLEIAFRLLFNWPLFNAFLSGRTMRPLIMLGASLAIVRQFDFDLMARMFNAYFPQQYGAASSWGTSMLTAMILAGGSASVSSIFTSLGLKSPLQQPLPKEVDETRAWIAVEVDSAKRNKTVVSITEVTYDGVSPVRTAMGVVGNPRPSFMNIITGDRWRVPRSGGMLVSANKYYTITARDLVSSKEYDVTGAELKSTADKPTIFHFGPRAIMDFRISVP